MPREFILFKECSCVCVVLWEGLGELYLHKVGDCRLTVSKSYSVQSKNACFLEALVGRIPVAKQSMSSNQVPHTMFHATKRVV